jgi:2'-5' RNA ligase
MSEQSLLPGLDDSPRPTDLIFFAALPDAGAIPAIQTLTQQIVTQHGLKGRPVIPGCLHVSLIELGEHAGLPSSLLESISRAAATVSQPTFDVAFDQVELFPRARACFLTESLRSNGFTALKDSLALALKQQNVKRKKSPAPHLTLLYDGKAVARQPVAPVAWTVKEFALLHRPLAQKGQPYNILGRWPLQD